MELDFNGQQVDVKLIDMETTKERCGSYLVVHTEYLFEYETPADTTPYEFENWLHDNHIDELIEMYQDEQ